MNFIKRFKENYVSVELSRIGGNTDGGYLLPDIFNDIEACFSPGVDYTATFEKHISDVYGIKSYMADANVESAPISGPNFEFDKKFLGNRDFGEIITLKSWINSKLPHSSNNLLLQMVTSAKPRVISL